MFEQEQYAVHPISWRDPMSSEYGVSVIYL